MKFNFIVVLFVTLNQYAQCQRFIVDVAYFLPPNLTPIATLCSGTVITSRHVLTTASCANVLLPFQVAITAHETLFENEDLPNATFTITSAAWVVFIHPNYIENRNDMYNVAIATSSGQIGQTYVPRSLGGLQHNTICTLHGWGGNLVNHRRDVIFVTSPQFCQASNPQSQIYCTFDISDCSAISGSPITCENETIISGFVLTNRSCNVVDSNVILSYHSVSEFRDWIDNTTEQWVPLRSSISFVVFVAQFTSNINSAAVRCSGTVITSNRVLTTADCATIESHLSLSIQSRGVTTSTTIHDLVVETFIHPNYNGRQNNNVAVLRINGNFRNGINPRSLGSLQSDSSCQLFGWGSHNDLTRIDAVTISGPQSCDPTQPDIYCSTFTSSSHFTCDAYLGSPVTCGSEAIVTGFLLNNRSCSVNNGRVVMEYLSVGQFQNWIDDPTYDPNGAINMRQLPILAIISAFVINFLK